MDTFIGFFGMIEWLVFFDYESTIYSGPELNSFPLDSRMRQPKNKKNIVGFVVSRHSLINNAMNNKK